MFRRIMWLNSSSTDLSISTSESPRRADLSARLQDLPVNKSTEDNIWPHNSSKHRIYTWTSYPSQDAKSEMDNLSSVINSASDKSAIETPLQTRGTDFKTPAMRAFQYGLPKAMML